MRRSKGGMGPKEAGLASRHTKQRAAMQCSLRQRRRARADVSQGVLLVPGKLIQYMSGFFNVKQVFDASLVIWNQAPLESDARCVARHTCLLVILSGVPARSQAHGGEGAMGRGGGAGRARAGALTADGGGRGG